jgi:hypothetical protein
MKPSHTIVASNWIDRGDYFILMEGFMLYCLASDVAKSKLAHMWEVQKSRGGRHTMQFVDCGLTREVVKSREMSYCNVQVAQLLNEEQDSIDVYLQALKNINQGDRIVCFAG